MLRSHERGRRPWLFLLLAVVVALVATACGSDAEDESSTVADGGATTTEASGGGDCGDITINENSWVGSSANVYVAKNILENTYGCTVDVTKIAEIPAFQAMADGKVDVVLEDWQHTTEYAKYIEEQKKVQDAGSLGVTGHIGWYVPTYVVDANPELATWEGLKTKASMFKTSESGSQGQLLDGDPSYVTNDEALVKNLGLDLKVVFAGGEASQITAVQQAYAKKEPILFYWYTPQWLNADLDLTEVKLPEYTAGCDADPKKVACAYPDYDLRKLMSSEFAESGSPAVDFIKAFTWGNDDQNEVAVSIAGKNMKPEDAAAAWVEANPEKVEAWTGGA
jgi:glycine betaine/proline transport system substrate-binding protein